MSSAVATPVATSTRVAPRSDAHLVYAGPAVESVSDDPEGGEVLRQSIACRQELLLQQRRRVHLACLPMIDGEENAAIGGTV